MDKICLPITPNGYQLEKGFLSTFDLDENILSEIIDIDDIDKYLIVRGDGEYISLNKDNPIKERVANIFFASTDKKLSNNKYQPIKYHHAKIWFFIYKNDNGNKVSKLIIQSENIYPYNSIEIKLSFIGNIIKEKQVKNNPLIAYFESLLPFLDDNKKEFINYLIKEIPYFNFALENNIFAADDFEFITPCCKDIPLLKEQFDEILIIAPFINVETINTLLKNRNKNAKCTVLSQPKIIESLIISGTKDVRYLSSTIDKFVHAKIYLLKKGETWDLYAGSMNFSDYSINKNIEAIVHLKNIKNVTNIESFLKDFLGYDFSDELKQYSKDVIKGNISPIFNDAFKIETRIKYIKKLLSNKKHDEEYMNHVSSYLLSSQSVKDLYDIAINKRELIPTKHQVITGKNKVRSIYKLSFIDNTLLGLVNYSLHKYDYLFSKNVFLHILERSVDNAFITIHEVKELKSYYLFKTDIHDFDPSIDKKVLCSQMDKLLSFDTHLCQFMKSIINEERFYLKGDNRIYKDDIIHQTGLPLGGFFENVYLYDFDFMMEKVPLYIRCGDDILIGSKNKNEIENLSKYTLSTLKNKNLSHNENKTIIASPGDPISYLGWKIINGEVDFSDSVIKEIQKNIKNKTKVLLIMYGKKKIPNALRLPSIVKYVNHYQKSEFFINCFKRITTTDGLKIIDKMIMDLIRTVVSGKTGSSKYKIKYETIQAFGYKSLVNQYYEYICK